jgi:hypothetical protein
MWHRGLDDKVSIGGEMTRGVLETADLIVGSEEIEDRVEDQMVTLI